MPIDEYESARPERRSQPELVLTRQDREEILIEWGATFHEIIDSIRANIRAKNQRRRTINSIGTYDRWEEAMESARNKLKQTLLLQKPIRKRAEDLQARHEMVAKLHGGHITYVHHVDDGGMSPSGHPNNGNPTMIAPPGMNISSSSAGSPSVAAASYQSASMASRSTVQAKSQSPIVTEPEAEAGEELRSLGMGTTTGRTPMQIMDGSVSLPHAADDPNAQYYHRVHQLHERSMSGRSLDGPVSEVGFEHPNGDDAWCGASSLAKDDDDDYYDDFSDLLIDLPPAIGTYDYPGIVPVGGNVRHNLFPMMEELGNGEVDEAAVMTLAMAEMSLQSAMPVDRTSAAPRMMTATGLPSVVISEDGYYDSYFSNATVNHGSDHYQQNGHENGFTMQPPPFSNSMVNKWE